MLEKSKINNKAFLLICIILLQAMLVTFMVWHMHLWMNEISLFPLMPVKNAMVFFIVSGFLLTVIALMLVHEVQRLAEEEVKSRDRLLQLEKAGEMLKVLKAHKHDFLNHLTVISGLIQINKNESVITYIKDVTNELKDSAKITRLTKPELAALVLTKQSEAEAFEVKLVADINTTLSDLSISSAELVRIVGNLLDNALYAVKKSNDLERRITLEIEEDQVSYRLAVSNTGSCIPGELMEKIFLPEFTTKGSDGSGMGLYIVRSLVERNGGRVEVTSNPGEGTAFTVFFPKEIKNS